MGSNNFAAEVTIEYSKYIAGESGNRHLKLFGLSLMVITFCFKVVLQRNNCVMHGGLLPRIIFSMDASSDIQHLGIL